MAYDQLNHTALAVMFIGLIGWLISVAFFIYRGFRHDGRPRFKKALFWFVITFIFMGVWITGMLYLGYHT